MKIFKHIAQNEHYCTLFDYFCVDFILLGSIGTYFVILPVCRLLTIEYSFKLRQFVAWNPILDSPISEITTRD